MFRNLTLTLFYATLCCAPAHAVVTFDWATVGNPGNADGHPVRRSRLRRRGRLLVQHQQALKSPTRSTPSSSTRSTATGANANLGGSDPMVFYYTSMGSSTRGGILRNGSAGS